MGRGGKKGGLGVGEIELLDNVLSDIRAVVLIPQPPALQR